MQTDQLSDEAKEANDLLRDIVRRLSKTVASASTFRAFRAASVIQAATQILSDQERLRTASGPEGQRRLRHLREHVRALDLSSETDLAQIQRELKETFSTQVE